jgi:hypothetical protein
MNNIKKEIRTVAEALEVIKELQAICKEQREKIKRLENEIGAIKSKTDSTPDFLKNLFK